MSDFYKRLTDLKFQKCFVGERKNLCETSVVYRICNGFCTADFFFSKTYFSSPLF